MATRRYGISKGENIDQVTEAVGAATVADSIELTVDFDAVARPSREDVILALRSIEARIMRGPWPPA
jgi:hypothetical protein